MHRIEGQGHYLKGALRLLQFVEPCRPTGRRFGAHAHARWGSSRGDLRTVERIGLLLRDADAECTAWDAQRAEDGGATKPIAQLESPPRYGSGDFEGNGWSLRGKLDVPKERFISYPGCESDEDGEPVYGWAGWDHLQRAQALAALYMNRKDREGWPKERLVPMLAGILELIPRVKQWHNDPSAEFDGLRMGDYFVQFLDGEIHLHSLTVADLRTWRPTRKSRGKAKVVTAPDASAEVPAKVRRSRKRKSATVTEPDGEEA